MVPNAPQRALAEQLVDSVELDGRVTEVDLGQAMPCSGE
jgi:hypothetical protein